MRKVLLIAAIAVVGLAVAMNASATSRQAVRDTGGSMPFGLSADCTLSAGNNCSGWHWVFTTTENSVWGTVLDPNSCPGGCLTGGAVSEVSLRLYCLSAPAPGTINSLGVATVDATGCPTGSLYESGPMTVTHCVAGDRWQTVSMPLVHVSGHPFALTLTWGPVVGGSNNPQFSTDNGIANLYCSMGTAGTFPGCSTTALTCSGWTMPAQNTYVYITDLNGDTILDDICAMYGVPYELSFPYFYPYGYITNNLMAVVGLDCSSPTAVENTSWGHVKALYE